ncbi:type II secretion system protein GspL [Kangiella koreensis]|uniref:Type II secretion system protein L n=1 Tax=Kangiella koreensis (strain DSM 16069 / JCM 12317 / KCTC 12182 / SW-125) TaxID=523791 RepID=C7R8F2_KANKD|nr:type II secretion system protein GspL [Kangiella koreensis]ACV27717.1 general secretion pathway protein L [Kangiella koreensis DSM 16069]
MKDRLFIRLKSDEESLEWGLLTYEESVPKLKEQGELLLDDMIALAEQANQQEVILLLPASRVRCFNVKAPTRSRKQLEKAVPYILEEQVLDNVEHQMFALGGVNSNGMLAVNVIDKAYLSSVLERLKEAAIEPDFAVSDAACLPLFEDAWTLLEHDDSVLVRQSANEYWSTEVDMLEDLVNWNLQTQFEENQTVSQAARIYSPDEQSELLSGVAGLAIQKMSVDNSLEWLCSQFDNSSINLLQQEFSSQKKSQMNLGQWKLPTIAASVLIGVGIIYMISQMIVLGQQRANLKQQMLVSVQEVFPNINDVNTGLIQVSNRFSTLGGDAASSNSFMLLFDRSLAAINPKEIKVSQLEYLSSQAQLSFDVEAASYTTLTGAQNKLESSGMQVEMRNASENGGVWSARISVGVKQ